MDTRSTIWVALTVGLTVTASAARQPIAGDFNQDGKVDLGLIKDGECLVWMGNRSGSPTRTLDLSYDGDYFLTSDFDLDKRPDLIVVSGPLWMFLYSRNNYAFGGMLDLGISGIPSAGDLDWDGRPDMIVYQSGVFYYWRSGENYQRRGPVALGPCDRIFIADYDGDGKGDLTFTQGDQWNIALSSAQKWIPHKVPTIGTVVVTDYDGDNRSDPGMVVHGTNWYYYSSRNNYAFTGPVSMTPQTTVAMGMVSQSKAGTLAAAIVTDGVQDITNAHVTINGVPLTYGFPLAFTNSHGHAVTLSLPMYAAALDPIPEGTPVAMTARQANGTLIYQSPAYAMPGPVTLLTPTNGEIFLTLNDLPLTWTAVSGIEGYLAEYLSPDSPDFAGESGLLLYFLPPTQIQCVLPASQLAAGYAVMSVNAMVGDTGVINLDNDTSLIRSCFALASSDEAEVLLAHPPPRGALAIAKEYHFTTNSLRFTVRESDPYQIQSPGTITVHIKMRRFKISVAFVAAFDMNGQPVFNWQYKRLFKRKNKHVSVSFSVPAGTTVVIGTHDASFRGGHYTY